MGSNKVSCKLSDVATFRNGAGIKQDFFTQSADGVKLAKISNFTTDSIDLNDATKVDPEHAQKWMSHQLKANDILIATVGSWPPNWSSVVGKVVRVPKTSEGAIQNQNTCCIIPKEPIDQSYLYYLLKTRKFSEWIVTVAQGSANQARIPVKNIGDFELELPPPEIQRQVASTLRNLDNKITLNRQINQTLEQMAQTLFKSWFVDFDPVMDNALDAGFFEQITAFPDELLRRAEARKAERESSDFKPLPEDIRRLFPAAFEVCAEPSLGLSGWVPKGWSTSTISDEFNIKGGSTPSTANPEFWDGGDIHWTSPKDLSGNPNKVLFTTERKITSAGLDKITSGLLPPETVLMSSRAPVGYLAITKIPTAINQGYIAVTKTKRLSQEFVLYWLDSNIDIIKSLSGGTTFAEISKKTFRTIPIIVPDSQAVDLSSKIIRSNLEKISENIEECRQLENLRDYLLPKLISGELEVVL